MDRYFPRKIERYSDTIALDRSDPNHPDRVVGVADHHFFTFSSRNHQHAFSLHVLRGLTNLTRSHYTLDSQSPKAPS